jgi:hypothetical protein
VVEKRRAGGVTTPGRPVARAGEEEQGVCAGREVGRLLRIGVVVVGGETCNCTAGLLLTKVSAPCTVTPSVGQYSIGSGECCVCTTN